MPLLIIILSSVFNLFAQVRIPDRGQKASQPLSNSGIDKVNLVNGNLMIALPLAALPQGRGESPDFPISLHYNSKLWDARREERFDGVPDENGSTRYFAELAVPSEHGGWRIGLGYRLIVRFRGDIEPMVPCDGSAEMQKNAYTVKTSMLFPDGTERELRPIGFRDVFGDGYFNVSPNGLVSQWSYATIGDGSGACRLVSTQTVTSGMTYYTSDGTYIRVSVRHVPGDMTAGRDNPWTMSLPNGTVVEHVPADDSSIRQRITDRNGNSARLKRGLFDGVDSMIVEDDTGRQTVYQSTLLGDKVISKGFRGERLETLVEWGVAHVRRIYNAADPMSLNAPPQARSQELYHALPVVKRITLPQQLGGLSYEFSYNGSVSRPDTTTETKGWGELVSMQMPTGARIGYRYALDEMPAISTSLDIVGNSVTERSVTFLAEYDGESKEIVERTRYRTGPDRSFVTGPDGAITESAFVRADAATCETGTVFSEKAADGTLIEYLWTAGCVNRYVRAEFRSVANASGAPVLTAVTEFVSDRNGNTLEKKEYDWVAYGSVPRMNGRVSGLPFGLRLIRKTVNTFYNPTPPGDGNVDTSPRRLRNVMKSTRIESSTGNIESYSEFEYDDTEVRGNVVIARSWDSTKGLLAAPDMNGFRLTAGNSTPVTRTYDRFGNALMTTDPRGFSTEVSFGPIEGVEGLYPTRKISAVATSVARTELFEYDLASGLMTRTVAVGNSAAESVEVALEYDASGRKTREISAKGTSAEAHTSIEYHDGRRAVVTRSDVEKPGDSRKVSVDHYDQLGRVRLSRELDGPSEQDALDESTGVKVQRRYLKIEGAEYELVSGPYRAASSLVAVSESSMGWKRTTVLRGGRVRETELFEGSDPPSPWGSNLRSKGVSRMQSDGDKSMMTDESGAKSVSRTNAVDDLTDVWEIVPSGDTRVLFDGGFLAGFKTSYSYDASGDLVRVMQGVQNRIFTYDSLSRLTSLSQPESGTLRFTHDANGNLRSRIDARGVETFYFYDALNRLVNRSYTLSDKIVGYRSQPAVTYSYDDMSVPFARGRLSRVHTSVSDSRIQAFDPLGRILSFHQLTDDRAFTSAYRFNLQGMLVEEIYPSGRVVRTDVDHVGEAARVSSGRSPSDVRRVYADAMRRDAAGNLVQMRYGNRLWETNAFNLRSALTSLSVGNSNGASSRLGLRNSFGVSDNGNLVRQRISLPEGVVREQTFGYDALNRLTSALETRGSTPTWSQVFSYDRFGNRSFAESGTSTIPKNCRSGSVPVMCSSDRKKLNPYISGTTNRFVSDQDGDKVEDYRHDPAGNLLRDPVGDSFFYDGENRQTLVKDAYGNTRGEYFYDGFGRRVKKITFVNNRPDETTVFVYAPDGRTLGEYSDRPERNLSGKTLFVTADHLGSPRMFTDQSGRVVNRHDYLPFGEEFSRNAFGSDTVRKQFTGYERDFETGLDYAGARYYSSVNGRFSTPDPARESMVPANPQSWNRYAYVLNNPLKFQDPSGELWILNTGGDRARNPYRWVDTCASGQTCWKSVALGTSDGVRVYGSRSAADISNYYANRSGQMNLESLLSHHDSNIVSAAMSQGIPEPFLSIKASAALFNVGVMYRERFAGDAKLVFTNGNGPDGKPCNYEDGRPCHSGHRGSDVDLRYMGGAGTALVGSGASANADPSRTRFIVDAFRRLGFPESFSGDPRRLGTLPASSGNKRLHRNHLHVGVFDSESDIRPMTQRKRRTR